mmetsp:Transcript_7880/g.11331  ORF Transcript_7880/g.11331 Transcript_7880/m.11331 type:complete len:293 (+) Transcript_7880:64-942(+)
MYCLVSQPKLSGISISGLELLPCLVGFFDNFSGGSGIEELLVESKSVKGLVIRGLVPTEPFPNTILNCIRNIIDITVFRGQRIIDSNGNNLPVKFTIINHGQNTKRFDLRERSHSKRFASNLNNIDRIVVTENLELRVLLVGVFPGLGDAAVVPEDGSVVITKVSLLDILGNGVALFLCGDLHFSLGHLRDFHKHVVAVTRLVRNIMPRGNITIFALEFEAEAFGGFFSNNFSGNGEKSSGCERSSLNKRLDRAARGSSPGRRGRDGQSKKGQRTRELHGQQMSVTEMSRVT